MNDIVIGWGSTYVIPFVIDDNDVDLTGYKLRFQVKRTKDSETVLMEEEDIAINAEELTAEFQLVAADWDKIPNKTMDYFYGTQIYNDDGQCYPFLDGKFKVEIAMVS